MTNVATASFTATLRRELRGDVRDDDGTRAAYAYDASNHRVLPQLVVLPRDDADVVRLVTRCAQEGIALTARGGGTSVAGNALSAGIVVDTSRYLTGVLALDPHSRTAVVQPGIVLDNLRAAARHYGLDFGVDPSTHSRCTIGGMIGTNACGSRSVRWGTTADNVEELQVVLAAGAQVTLGTGERAVVSDGGSAEFARSLGEQLRAVRDRHLADVRLELGRFPRQVSGYALQHLLPENGFSAAKSFVGSEGTWGIVTAARVRLVEPPAVRLLVIAAFTDDIAAAAAAPGLAGMRLFTVEGMDAEVVAAYDAAPGPHRRPELPRGGAWLLLEVGGSDASEAGEHAAAVRRGARDRGALSADVVTDPRVAAAIWRIRERGAGLATRVGGREHWPGWEDAAVPPDRLADYLLDFRTLLRRYGRHGVLYGHFGEGCVHVRIDHDLRSEPGRRAYRSFQEDAADVVLAHHGSLSGEHGDGRARSELLSRMYSPRVLAAFEATKGVFDPQNLLNPGVIVDPRPLDADLQLAQARPHTVDLAFGYREDDGDFSKAVHRCVGVGACRSTSGGGMCPSYRATADERHSTRGRARVLAEMLDGSLSRQGWRSKPVKEALDLCLACKACASECPVNVDMATYKAEFLSHHYRWRPRPMAHYSMGWLPLWLAIVRPIAGFVNWLLSQPGVESVVKFVGGIERRRAIPRLGSSAARRRIRDGRRSASAPLPSAPRLGGNRQRTGTNSVLLWLDTFTESFSPEVAEDAIAVLETAGYTVEVGGRGQCCGLTWVSTGQLGMAKRVLRRTVQALDDPDDRRLIVVLEPSCGAALRTDLPDLLPGPAADRIAGRIRSLAEVLAGRDLPWLAQRPSAQGRRGPGGDVTPSRTRAVAQFHCHQRAVFGTAADREVLQRAGVAVRSVDEGCCGLAGNFGFEKGHDEISRTCAEQSFLPHLATHDQQDPVLADGFSCRVQIEQVGGRTGVHLASLLRERLEPPAVPVAPLVGSFGGEPPDRDPRQGLHQPDPRAQQGPQGEPRPSWRPEPRTRSEQDFRGRPDPRLRPQPDPRLDPRARPERGPEPEPRTQPGPRAGPEPRTRPEPRTEPGPRRQPNPRHQYRADDYEEEDPHA